VAKQTEVLVHLVDDIDGTKASETIRFSYDGGTYEIDLSAKNARALRKALDSWAEHARKVTAVRRGRGGRRAAPRSAARNGWDPKAVRQWAATNGISVPSRGRIPTAVAEQYRASAN
jgi:uncharacterized membrane protein